MSAVLAIVGLAVVFYFLHQMHGHMGNAAEPGASAARPPEPAETEGATGGGLGWGALLLLTLLLVLPLMLLHSMIPMGSPTHAVLFWAALLLPILILPFALPTSHRPRAASTGTEAEVAGEGREAERQRQRLELVGPLGECVGRELTIEVTRYEDELIVFEGRLRGDAAAAYTRLMPVLADLGRAPRFLEGEHGRTLIVTAPMPREEPRPARQSVVVPALLLLATLATTTWAGALHQGIDLWQTPGRFAVGLPYALALLAILMVHELGHYIAGRIHGINVTLPYFIPIPMGLGTFGAFIRIRGAIPDRPKLFDVGVAGPLAGLAVALPALYVGLQGAAVAPSGPGVSLSGSLLLAWVYGLANPGAVPADHLVRLRPVAFAGWLGLLVTALNLIPVGQLDGGHVAYALFGRRRGETVGWVAFFLLLTLGIFYWSGWLTWAVLIFFLGGVKHEPALNEVPAPGWKRRAIGALAFLLLFLIMAPVPHRFMSAVGIVCPYL